MSDIQQAMELVTVLRAAFIIVTGDIVDSYEAQVIRESILTQLTSLIAEVCEYLRKAVGVITREGLQEITRRFKGTEKPSTERVCSLLREELEDIIRGANNTLFYRVLDIEAPYRAYAAHTPIDFATYLQTLPEICRSGLETTVLQDIYDRLAAGYVRTNPNGKFVLIKKEAELRAIYLVYIEDLAENGLYCRACDLSVASAQEFEEHLQGRRHKANMKKKSKPDVYQSKGYKRFRLEELIALMHEGLKAVLLGTIQIQATQPSPSIGQGIHDYSYVLPRVEEYVKALIGAALNFYTRRVRNQIYVALEAIMQRPPPQRVPAILEQKRYINRNTGEVVPRWQYEAQGLAKRYHCEVCGRKNYYGPQTFSRHFLTRLHRAGLSTLGVPTEQHPHFRGLSRIADVRLLLAKLSK
ncbi:Splicesome-associated protein [Giardia muris]|uniref:Splicesome-associated protein n=1 Tax=Giardia muris TaxID=5742 RepID=A0A4Z1T6E8_GIAMU|nr:Splicesome-associated protein [Giardia muris]|eukprot:TNJ29633.1 Splicesome-associated protein [Giardia muris]